jgi:hypothetical protein
MGDSFAIPSSRSIQPFDINISPTSSRFSTPSLVESPAVKPQTIDWNFEDDFSLNIDPLDISEPTRTPSPPAIFSLLPSGETSSSWIAILKSHLEDIHALSILRKAEDSRALHNLRYILIVRLTDTISRHGHDSTHWPSGALAYVQQLTVEVERVRLGLRQQC